MAKILLVEDNPDIRDMLTRRLQRKQFEVVTACDGAEGCRMADAEKPDVILMDLQMPVLDGLGATRQLKTAAATRAIPIIALTAHAMSGDREKALEAGCDDYETKPIEFSSLVGKINSLLERRTSA